MKLFSEILIKFLLIHRVSRDRSVYTVSNVYDAVSVIICFLYHLSQATIHNAIPGSLYRISVTVRDSFKIFLCLLK